MEVTTHNTYADYKFATEGMLFNAKWTIYQACMERCVDDDVRFALDEYVEFDIYRARSLQQVRG